jgi:hypothetical protein
MKKMFFFVVSCAISLQFASAQNNPVKFQKSVTDPDKGFRTEYGKFTNAGDNDQSKTIKYAPVFGTNWQVTDNLAIDNITKVSSAGQKTAAGWTLNNQRLSLYGTTNVPIWEVPLTISTTEESVDMTEDGTRIANGYSNTIEVFNATSSIPVWSVTSQRAVTGIKISDDGLKVFVAESNIPASDSCFLYCYTVGQNTPVWVKSYPGNYTSLAMNRIATRIILGEYGGTNNVIHVLNTADGSFIFDAPSSDQYPPAISRDGSYIVNGNFSGYVYVYQYDNALSTYAQKWSAKVNGTNSWVCGMGISDDGSTIAVGTLVFTATGYDGELYVYDNYSPTPLWIYSGMGDMVQCVSVSGDGSIIAAAGWGPIDNSGPDLYLFRKTSNIPYFTLNTPGSLFTLDLSDDGKACSTGGKGVHARAFGSGGNLYNINSDPGGGTLSGHAVKSGSSSQAGVKVEIEGQPTYYDFTNDSSVYNVRYIPAGTYSVKYSAIGYITQVLTGVQITSGQTITRDVTLLAVGSPPTNLTATQGAQLYVQLSWDASPAPNVTGYDVYRKLYDFSNYPGIPIGSTGAGQLTYNDSTALPLTHYYYAVTAKIQDSLQSPYSNDAIGWIASGFVTNSISAYVGTTPIIDGTLSPGEWSDAFRVDLSDFLGIYDNTPDPIGSVMGYFKVNAALTSLYCAVENFNDTVLNDHDEVGLYVDDNHDGAFPAPSDNSEGNYWAVHYSTGDLLRYRPIYNTGGVGTTVLVPNAQVKISSATGHIVYEFVLPLGVDSTWQINFNSQHQSGIFIFALDDPSSFNGWWPCTNANIFSPAGYGTITFGAIDSVPPPPNPLQLFNPIAQDITLQWVQPNINDFDHFNIYESINGGAFNLIDHTIGVQYFLTVTNGTYAFRVTTVDIAGHESIPSNIVTANVTVGLPELTGDISMMKFGPNPFTDQLFIDLKTERQTALQAVIYDLNGKQVFPFINSQVSQGYHHYSWNGRSAEGNNLPAGVYTLFVRTSGGVMNSYKLIKVR